MSLTEQVEALRDDVTTVRLAVARIEGNLANGVVRRSECDERHRGLTLRILGMLMLGGGAAGAIAAVLIRLAFS